jgi:hypothetical protein
MAWSLQLRAWRVFHSRMSRVLAVRISPGLLAKAEVRAVRLGLGRAGYVRSLIEEDLRVAKGGSAGQFASEDLVGAFRLGGQSATNRRARENLSARSRGKCEAHC